MTGTIIKRGHRKTVVPGLMIQGALTAWFAAAAGTTVPTSAVRRTAAATGPTTAAAASAFVSPGPLPLALDFLHPWQEAAI
jgi:hypothetical protein